MANAETEVASVGSVISQELLLHGNGASHADAHLPLASCHLPLATCHLDAAADAAKDFVQVAFIQRVSVFVSVRYFGQLVFGLFELQLNLWALISRFMRQTQFSSICLVTDSGH